MFKNDNNDEAPQTCGEICVSVRPVPVKRVTGCFDRVSPSF